MTWYETISVNDKIRWVNNYLSIKKDLETLDLVWLWLHNYPLSDSGKQQIKEWFDNDK